MKIFLKYQRLTILWALFVFVMCTVKINEQVSDEPMFFPGFDKLVHSGFFFLLVVLCCNGIIRKQSKRLLPYKTAAAVTIACILFGGVIEVLQSTVFTWRDGDWTDLFADSVGACMGIFSVMVINRANKYEEN
jgi:VanZ family protein